MPVDRRRGFTQRALEKAHSDARRARNAAHHSGGTAKYYLYRAVSALGPWAKLGPSALGATTWSDTNTLSCGKTYYHKIASYHPTDGQYSATVGPVKAKTHVCAPNTPTNVVATPVTSSRIDLTWNDSSSIETSHQVERSLDGITGWTEIANLPANTTSYSSTGLSCQKKYYYRVRSHVTTATNGSAYSSYSSIANATTPA